jgi:hypothetical protein
MRSMARHTRFYMSRYHVHVLPDGGMYSESAQGPPCLTQTGRQCRPVWPRQNGSVVLSGPDRKAMSSRLAQTGLSTGASVPTMHNYAFRTGAILQVSGRAQTGRPGRYWPGPGKVVLSSPAWSSCESCLTSRRIARRDKGPALPCLPSCLDHVLGSPPARRWSRTGTPLPAVLSALERTALSQKEPVMYVCWVATSTSLTPPPGNGGRGEGLTYTLLDN